MVYKCDFSYSKNNSKKMYNFFIIFNIEFKYL